MKDKSFAIIAVIFFPVFLFAADPGHCPTPDYPKYYWGKLVDYKISTAKWWMVDLASWEAQIATTLAADRWNSETKAGIFVYDGMTSDNGGLPSTDFECELLGINKSKVKIKDGCHADGYSGIAKQRCCGLVDCDEFEIRVFTQVGDNCAPQSFLDATDLSRLLTHEFGHTLNIEHPQNNEYAIMCNMAEGNCHDTAGYHLKQYDIKCATEESIFNPDRDSCYLMQYLSGYIDPFYHYISKEGAYRVDVDYNSSTSGLNEVYVEPYNSDFVWYPDSDPNNVQYISTDFRNSIVNAFHFEAASTYDYLASVDHADNAGMETDNSYHLVYLYRSNDMFETYEYTGVLRYCTTMTDWMYCPPFYRFVASTPRRLATAALDIWEIIPTTIVAWVDQRNTYPNRINISAGMVNSSTVATPIGFETSLVSPGIACEYGAAPGGYDCIIAYLPTSPEYINQGLIHIKVFSVMPGVNNNSFVFGNTTYLAYNETTSSDIAAWYNNGKWWLGFQSSSESGQPLTLMSSTDLINWDTTHRFGTIGGPSVTSSYYYDYIYALH